MGMDYNIFCWSEKGIAFYCVHDFFVMVKCYNSVKKQNDGLPSRKEKQDERVLVRRWIA